MDGWIVTNQTMHSRVTSWLAVYSKAKQAPRFQENTSGKQKQGLKRSFHKNGSLKATAFVEAEAGISGCSNATLRATPQFNWAGSQK